MLPRFIELAAFFISCFADGDWGRAVAFGQDGLTTKRIL